MSLNSKRCLSFGEMREEIIKILVKCKDGNSNYNHGSNNDYGYDVHNNN
jgi:hypothetical protein